MRITKVFTAILKTDLNKDNLKGKKLRLEFELNNKISVLANNEWNWQIDTLNKNELNKVFENITFLKNNYWVSI